MSPINIAQFAASICLQVLALSLFPLSHGFTRLWPSAAVVLLFGAAMALLARLTASGVPLSIVVPLSAATVPLGTIIVAITVHHEAASPLRIATLVLASCLIGIAGKL